MDPGVAGAAKAVAQNEVLRRRRVEEILLRSGLDRSLVRRRAQIIAWAGSRSTGADLRWRHQVLRETLGMVQLLIPAE